MTVIGEEDSSSLSWSRLPGSIALASVLVPLGCLCGPAPPCALTLDSPSCPCGFTDPSELRTLKFPPPISSRPNYPGYTVGPSAWNTPQIRPLILPLPPVLVSSLRFTQCFPLPLACKGQIPSPVEDRREQAWREGQD